MSIFAEKGLEWRRRVDAEIVNRARSTLAAVLKETASRCGGLIREEDGLLLVAANHPCPVLANSALRTGSMNAGEALQRAQAFFGELGHGWETWTREDADADLQQAAETMGLCAAPDLIGMVLDSRPDLSDVPPNVELCWVRGMPGVRDFVSVAADGFREEAPGLPDLIRAIFSERASLVAPDTAAFVVRYRGEPAATALAMVKEDVAWIGWVATRHHLRGRGLGRLVTAAAASAGFTLGAKFASLEATTMGFPVYQRLGFREIVRYRNYWPAGFGS
jgi:GNAT superfamily N-acetyltransferase